MRSIAQFELSQCASEQSIKTLKSMLFFTLDSNRFWNAL